MGACWRFFDRKIGDPWFDPERLQAPGTKAGSRSALLAIPGIALALAATPLIWSTGNPSASERQFPAAFALPQVPGWSRLSRASGRPRQPHSEGADRLHAARSHAATRRADGTTVDIFH